LIDKNLSIRKQNIAAKAWIAVQGDKQTTGENIVSVLRNKENATEILEVFPGTLKGKITGIITSDQFEQYCREISTFIPNDEYFVKHLE